jgi:NAD(P)-dependent dehydrogenase (short-subunit alcohol dehydrogenase family)
LLAIDFYEEVALDARPSPLDTLVVDINYKAVISTSRLALHYFRKSLAKHSKSDPVLIMTASCGGLYPAEFYPMYSGSKAAVIHFHRAIAVAYHYAGVRTFAICPGTVQTGLKSPEEWKLVPENFFTPIEIVVNTVIDKLVDGGDIKDSKGRNVQAKENWGLTVEINGSNIYFRDGVEHCDEIMKNMMKITSMEAQLGRIEKTEGEHTL